MINRSKAAWSIYEPSKVSTIYLKYKYLQVGGFWVNNQNQAGNVLNKENEYAKKIHF